MYMQINTLADDIKLIKSAKELFVPSRCLQKCVYLEFI